MAVRNREAPVPSLFGQRGGDSENELRAALDAGRLVDTGEAQVNGRTVRRLSSRLTDDPRDLIVLTYDVDPQTFAPVGGSRTSYMPPRKQGGKKRLVDTMTFTVEVFERLRLTPENEARLQIPVGKDTQVVTCRVKSPKWPRPLLGC